MTPIREEEPAMTPTSPSRRDFLKTTAAAAALALAPAPAVAQGGCSDIDAVLRPAAHTREAPSTAARR